MKKILITLLAIAFLAVSCGKNPPASTNQQQTSNRQNNALSSAQAKNLIAEEARQVISVINYKDFQKLSEFVHPDQGVRFSPYTYVSASDRVFSQIQLKTLYQNNTKYLWGYTDGEGAPINLNFRDYYARYVYDINFAQLGEVSYNELQGKGNTVDNTAEYYKNSIVVEYYFPGTKQFDGMDWKSLKLVFQEKNGVWYLVGIVHDQWTI